MASAQEVALIRKLEYAHRQRAFAWAKYYAAWEAALHQDHEHHHHYEVIAETPAIPEHIKTEMKEMAASLHKKWECPICLEMIADGELTITNCGHFYCKECLASHKEHEMASGRPKWKCAVCKRQHNFRGDEE